MTERSQLLGAAGERIASRYLEQHGYEVVDKNVRRTEGEIDLVALKGDTLVFVEVKLRTSRKMGAAVQQISTLKGAKLRTLAEAYTVAGNANNALVIPAGLAFARSIAIKPDINLYAPDKRHPSVEGTYLSAATTYAALFNKSPVGLKFSAGLKPEVAAHLQQVAWDTVQQYLNR